MKINPNTIPEVAAPFMQETHMEEVDMLNSIYALLDAKVGNKKVANPELTQQIEALATHTHAHFAREEEKMITLNFPPYAMHKQAHDEYLQQFDALLNTWRQSGNLAPLAQFLKETTPAWMQRHISTMDFVTANFFIMCEK